MWTYLHNKQYVWRWIFQEKLSGKFNFESNNFMQLNFFYKKGKDPEPDPDLLK